MHLYPHNYCLNQYGCLQWVRPSYFSPHLVIGAVQIYYSQTCTKQPLVINAFCEFLIFVNDFDLIYTDELNQFVKLNLFQLLTFLHEVNEIPNQVRNDLHDNLFIDKSYSLNKNRRTAKRDKIKRNINIACMVRCV